MQRKYHDIIASLLVVCFGMVVLAIGTDGFQAFTSEQARTNQLISEQPVIPNIMIEDSKARLYPIDEFQENTFLFVTFMYTNCGTVCPQLERNMQKVYEILPEKYINEKVRFLSISFDTDTDDPETLATYQSYFDSDGETWRMARIPSEIELQQLLDQLGVIVIPDDYGNFQHNSAFYLLNEYRQLVDVMDYTKVEQAAKTITQHIEEKF
ncbi:protein SCO1/2 [Gracilibacillus ureilyticus]|uniref:Protein SCO1/2 n=1 Tax=Gracilibacillus ureilyticus TaxID=531814 RepID=A0A1H9P778_9BACI|nr:SCO family protein [Gracilibacillus ureilyticus]SER43433.1 protein SCO1/2 [Gracilibacillus ureilyticus]